MDDSEIPSSGVERVALDNVFARIDQLVSGHSEDFLREECRRNRSIFLDLLNKLSWFGILVPPECSPDVIPSAFDKFFKNMNTVLIEQVKARCAAEEEARLHRAVSEDLKNQLSAMVVQHRREMSDVVAGAARDIQRMQDKLENLENLERAMAETSIRQSARPAVSGHDPCLTCRNSYTFDGITMCGQGAEEEMVEGFPVAVIENSPDVVSWLESRIGLCPGYISNFRHPVEQLLPLRL